MRRWFKRIAAITAITSFWLGATLWILGAVYNPIYQCEAWQVDGNTVHYLVHQVTFGGGGLWAHRSERRWELRNAQDRADFHATHPGSSRTVWTTLKNPS